MSLLLLFQPGPAAAPMRVSSGAGRRRPGVAVLRPSRRELLDEEENLMLALVGQWWRAHRDDAL